MPYLETRGPSSGKCNICGKTKKLTIDHVPPKGVLKFRSVTLTHIAPKQDISGRDFQQGVTFRTICKSCNGDLLGATYDPALIKFSNAVHDYLTSEIALPNRTYLSTQPDLVIRSILGHLLALGVNREPIGDLYSLASQLVINPQMSIPPELKVFYWLHPYYYQVAIRGFGFLPKQTPSAIVAAILKFPPFAFMVIHDKENKVQLGFDDLTRFVRKNGQSELIPMRFDSSKLPRRDYPEMPDDADITFALHGEDSYIATLKPKLIKTK